MYFLVPAHSGCPGQSPESCKIVVCMCVCVCVCVCVRACVHACMHAFVRVCVRASLITKKVFTLLSTTVVIIWAGFINQNYHWALWCANSFLLSLAVESNWWNRVESGILLVEVWNLSCLIIIEDPKHFPGHSFIVIVCLNSHEYGILWIENSLY